MADTVGFMPTRSSAAQTSASTPVAPNGSRLDLMLPWNSVGSCKPCSASHQPHRDCHWAESSLDCSCRMHKCYSCHLSCWALLSGCARAWTALMCAVPAAVQ